MVEYVLTDANGDVIDEQGYDTADQAIDARARLMAEHPDGDEVTVEIPCVLCDETSDSPETHEQHMQDVHDRAPSTA